jgi:pimeloyl-ACP methyl ester carboxylesterase
MLIPLFIASALATATGTADLTIGQLTFSACELSRPKTSATTAALCAPFEVPENRDVPNGRKIALRLALIRAESGSPKSDIVVYLAGGPGQAATETYSAMAGALAPLNRTHHILLLDQRGTGGSHALKCAHADDENAGDEADDNDDGTDHEIERLQNDITECLGKLDADPRFYTTSDAVHDLEDVREKIGKPQFDLVGVSYGTRMAQAYLRAHGDGVRSAILDGVVPNELILGASFARDLESALKLDFTNCNKSPECAKRFDDPYKTLYALRGKLRDSPSRVTIADPQTFQPIQRTVNESTLAGLVRLFAYSSETAALLPLSLDQAIHGNYAPLLGQSKLISGDLDVSITGGMELSVICAEDADLLKPTPEDADTILGNKVLEGIQAECKIWPHGTRPADFHAPLKSDKPVLLLSGENDPVTPPANAELVLKNLPNGRHLIAKGQGHNVILRGCLPRLVAKFVDTLDEKKLDAACLDTLGPVPAFLDFNGAAP